MLLYTFYQYYVSRWKSHFVDVAAIDEYTAVEEADDRRHWRTVNVAGQRCKIDMKAIEPYKKVLSHGGKTCSRIVQDVSVVTSAAA